MGGASRKSVHGAVAGEVYQRDLDRAYSRAARLTGPHVSLTEGRVFPYGYWLDSDTYFYVHEVFDPKFDCTVPEPMLVSRSDLTAYRPIERSALISAIADADVTFEPSALAHAEFDMPDRSTISVSLPGKSWLLAVSGQHLCGNVKTPDRQELVSPDRLHACFVRGHDLWLRELESGVERQLTFDGEEFWRYGQQPETCLAAISYRREPTPMACWSPDGKWLLTHRIDERSLPDQRLLEQARNGDERPVLHTYKYPLPGDPLPEATFLAIEIASGRTLQFPDATALVTISSHFQRRTAWFGTDGRAWMLRCDRNSRRLELVMLDTQDGNSRVVVCESSETYVEPHNFALAQPNVAILEESNEFIWFSEREGWPHLYLHDLDTGACKRALTRGDWAVRDIVGVDPVKRKIWFLASGSDNRDDPLWRSFWCVSLDGGAPKCVLRHAGDISVGRAIPFGEGGRRFRQPHARCGTSPDYGAVVARLGDPVTGDRTILYDFDRNCELAISASEPRPDEPRAKRFTVQSADQSVELNGLLFLPPDWDGQGSLPLIDFVYPGPHVTQVPQFHGSLKAAPARALASIGFAVMMLDSRGTPGRGRDFHQAGYGHLIEPQLADHAATVRQICARHSWIDGERVGIIGTSAGGTAAARAMFDYGDIFRVGVAVAGNHNPSLYISSWSDKYRGEYTADWDTQPNAAAAHRLSGELMLVVGGMDENVHPAHTLGLANALIAANKDFELLVVPDAGHELMHVNGYTLRRIWDFFVRHLMKRNPPEFELGYTSEALTRFATHSKLEIDL